MKLLLYPDGVHNRYNCTMIKAYIEHLGIEVVTDPAKEFDVVMYQSYHKHYRRHNDTIRQLSKKYDIINIGCEDVRKSKNEEIMLKAFGYNSALTKGCTILEKSELQGKHDMQVVSKIRNKPGYIYVKLLDNKISATHVRDYRILVFDYKVRAIMTKDKPLKDRFAGVNSSNVTWCDYSALSVDEIDNIENYCKLYKTHYTELDAVRDNGELYIIDNNNCPAYAITTKNCYEANNMKHFKYLSKYFEQMIDNHAN